jgi:hypothetical protein
MAITRLADSLVHCLWVADGPAKEKAEACEERVGLIGRDGVVTADQRLEYFVCGGVIEGFHAAVAS